VQDRHDQLGKDGRVALRSNAGHLFVELHDALQVVGDHANRGKVHGVPDTGSLEGDITAILTNIGHLLGAARWSTVLPSIVDVAERDPEFADVHRRIQHGHAAPLRDVLERASARGEPAPSADPSTIIAALLGPLFYRRWFSREPIDDRFIKTITRGAIATDSLTP
jgi:hypothetical protein